MKALRYLGIILFSVPLFSCINTDEASFEGDLKFSDPMTKVVKLSDEYDAGSFLVKFDKVPSEAFLAEISAGKGMTLEKLFTSTPGKEELEARFGLDRWYYAEVAEDGAMELMMTDMASLSEVTLVQYNHKAKKASDGVVYHY